MLILILLLLLGCTLESPGSSKKVRCLGPSPREGCAFSLALVCFKNLPRQFYCNIKTEKLCCSMILLKLSYQTRCKYMHIITGFTILGGVSRKELPRGQIYQTAPVIIQSCQSQEETKTNHCLTLYKRPRRGEEKTLLEYYINILMMEANAGCSQVCLYIFHGVIS